MLESLFFYDVQACFYHSGFTTDSQKHASGYKRYPLRLRGPLKQLSLARASLENSSVVYQFNPLCCWGHHNDERMICSWIVCAAGFLQRFGLQACEAAYLQIMVKKNCEFASLNCCISHRTKIVDFYYFA